jgi:hypothetical protein
MINKQKGTSHPMTKAEEYKEIGKDLKQVLWLNLLYLVLILAVFFTDQKYHYLMRIFGRLWK